MRYLVESANTVLFWMVPVVYSFAIIPANYKPIYQLNPVAALVMAMRDILMEGTRPGTALMLKLTAISIFMLALGLVVFRSLKPRFSDHL
jgi:ABC-type polysaccharide/polyol phosphate export permease